MVITGDLYYTHKLKKKTGFSHTESIFDYHYGNYCNILLFDVEDVLIQFQSKESEMRKSILRAAVYI
jgi:hypothetical protein